MTDANVTTVLTSFRIRSRIVLLFAGCLSGTGCMMQETRLLSWFPRAPAVEAKSYDLHDPFPDELAGPDTYTRPRAFMEPRSDTRKSSELRFLQASKDVVPQPAAFWDPMYPTGSASVPVQPLWRSRMPSSPIASAPRMWDGRSTNYNVVTP